MVLEENGEDKLVRKITNEYIELKERRERIGGTRTLIFCIEKPIGLVIFQEEIAFFIMPLKNR